MALEHRGQRLLLALQSGTGQDGNNSMEPTTLVGVLLSVVSLVCLALVVLLCTCSKEANKQEDMDEEARKTKQEGKRKGSGHSDREFVEIKEKATTVVENGGSTGNKSNSGHSRQASSGSAHLRPTSLRELPEPPVTAAHHSRSTASPDIIECDTESANDVNVATGSQGDEDFVHHHYQEPHPRKGAKNSSAGGGDVDRAKDSGLSRSDDDVSDGYDHFGVKPNEKPAHYDTFGDIVDREREGRYAVVQEVKKKKVYDPYSHVKDSEDSTSQTDSTNYSQMKDEDPYNLIGESDGMVTRSMIQRIQAGGDVDDPYSTLPDDETGEVTHSSDVNGAVGGTPRHSGNSGPKMPASSHDSYGSDEYAVVKKVRPRNVMNDANEEGNDSGGTIQPYSIGPPEPPRLYGYDDDNLGQDEEEYEDTASVRSAKDHKYSKVTARESLASMSARNALNTYEVLSDFPENTYATVEGGSGDGVVVMRNRSGNSQGGADNRLSQASDTYAEIAISGGGLTSSIISNSSSTGGGSNTNGAPVPPSLDSLHMMTKSQTSSEGDRLSDRHLASPEDTAVGILPWADEEGSAGSSEDGYSTLRRSNVTGAMVPGSSQEVMMRVTGTTRESGEVKLNSNYQTVKDFISDDDQVEELENDPYYASVDEAKAAIEGAAAVSSPTSSTSSRHQKIKVVQVFHNEKALGFVNDTQSKGDHPQNGSRGRSKRQLDHDYDEVELSPSSFPAISPLMSNQHSPTVHPSSTDGAVSNGVDELSEARNRVLQSHLYQEVPVARPHHYDVIPEKKGAQSKSSQNDKKKNSDKKKPNGTDKDSRTKGEENKKGRQGSQSKKSGAGSVGVTRL